MTRSYDVRFVVDITVTIADDGTLTVVGGDTTDDGLTANDRVWCNDQTRWIAEEGIPEWAALIEFAEIHLTDAIIDSAKGST